MHGQLLGGSRGQILAVTGLAGATYIPPEAAIPLIANRFSFRIISILFILIAVFCSLSSKPPVKASPGIASVILKVKRLAC